MSKQLNLKVGIIGGGAAGFFAAMSVKTHHPSAQVTIYEKSQKLLSKVKISGGGRCNVTNGCTSIRELSKAYPRGEQDLRQAFRQFSTKDTMHWFESRGVELVIQDDNCVFPKSQDSQTIIDCFLKEAAAHNIQIKCGYGVQSISKADDKLELTFKKDEIKNQHFDKVIVATGGSPKLSGLNWLKEIEHQIEQPVPSLFTFNMPEESITELMGIVVEETIVSIQGTKLKADGPLLITHWGMSGPAILKLSAFGARILESLDYSFIVQVNWANEKNEDFIKSDILEIVDKHPKKQIQKIRPFGISTRLWHVLLDKANLPLDKPWQELGKKGINKMVQVLSRDEYKVKGKTTFKEEFVTCGGVSLSDIDMKTMQSKQVPNLYFAGEVIDIDGITGGYNFQSAWTTGYIAGQLR